MCVVVLCSFLEGGQGREERKHARAPPPRSLPGFPSTLQRATHTHLSALSSPPPPLPHPQILFSEGNYTYLDVRPELELDETGKVRGCVNVGLFDSKRVWDSEKGEKIIVKKENPDFIKQVEKKIPDKETFIIVGCSDGTAYTMDALQLLDDAGYINLVGLKGGFYTWFRTWDTNLRRRRGDGYTEAYDGEGSDSCGVHATGAGFERADKIEGWAPPKY